MSSIRRGLARIVAILIVAATLSIGLTSATSAAPGHGSDPGPKPSAAELAEPGMLDGTVTTPDDGLVFGDLTVYQWQPDGEFFDYYDDVYFNDETSPAGYALSVDPGRYYVEFTDDSDSYETGYGNGATEPAKGTDSPGVVTVTADGGATADVALTALAEKQPVTGSVQNPAGEPLADIQLGRVAGQDLDYCRANVLTANDDSSSGRIDIPFDLKFFGTPYETLFVNNNGNVTLGDSLSQFTPEDLTGATGVPIIAPFFADVDTRSVDSNVVTYGASPDGHTFCVNWADVGYYSQHADKLNTFQLLLTQNTSGAGRVAGDFDITFNFDQILWETGDVSGGQNGFGGTSAATGFSAGTGQAGTFVQLPGSLVNGALLDSGPNALVAGSQNSGQVGRYVYQVRNDGLVSELGNLQGTVLRAAGGSPVVDAYVEACPDNETGCTYTETDASGGYFFNALPTGGYEIGVWPPTDDLFGGGATALVSAGGTTTVDPIELSAPVPMPPNVELTNNGIDENGIPSVYYGDPLQFQVTGCAGVANPSYTVTLASGEIIRNQLPMTESPAGTYSATIAPLVPDTGDAEISTNIPATCGGDPVAFNVYIDPSGIVTDQYGRPIVGATVTLLRSDTANGEFSMVPDGSDIMSPSNRANPSVTDDTGFFRWDVQVGWYKVQVENPGCTTTTTNAMEVPPEKIDLLIKLSCTAAPPTPVTAPSVSGTPKVGQTITAQPAVWGAPLVASRLQLLRNGTPLPNSSYQLTATDSGASFTARATGRRPDYVTESGTGQTVTFTPVSATSSKVQVAKLGSKTTAQLTKARIPAGTRGTLKVTVKVRGVAGPTGKIKVYDGKKLIKTVKLKAAKGGVLKVKLPELTKGKHKLSATYLGSTSINRSTSRKVTLTVVK